MEEIMIDICNVKKEYRLGAIGGGTLKGDLQSWWARRQGKEDPNSTIGQEQRLVGQKFMALNGINLKIHKGEALGIIGGEWSWKIDTFKIVITSYGTNRRENNPEWKDCFYVGSRNGIPWGSYWKRKCLYEWCDFGNEES